MLEKLVVRVPLIEMTMALSELLYPITTKLSAPETMTEMFCSFSTTLQASPQLQDWILLTWQYVKNAYFVMVYAIWGLYRKLFAAPMKKHRAMMDNSYFITELWFVFFEMDLFLKYYYYLHLFLINTPNLKLISKEDQIYCY